MLHFGFFVAPVAPCWNYSKPQAVTLTITFLKAELGKRKAAGGIDHGKIQTGTDGELHAGKGTFFTMKNSKNSEVQAARKGVHPRISGMGQPGEGGGDHRCGTAKIGLGGGGLEAGSQGQWRQTGAGGATAKGNHIDDSTNRGPSAHGQPEECRPQAASMEKIK